MSRLRSVVVAAKTRLAEGYREWKRSHQAGCPGGKVCAGITDLRDEVVRELFNAARGDLANSGGVDLGPHVALVAHGGYGRRDIAPFSDVDLMILHHPSVRDRVVPLADRLLRDVFDAGLILGHSVRTPQQAASLACGDPTIATSLIESRLLAGGRAIFTEFEQTFRRQVRRQAQKLLAAIVEQRNKERARYGETVYLLEPNVKRSQGSLRDLQLIRWIGLVRYGTPDPRQLASLEALSPDDVQVIEHAGEFLLRLRNEMHFQAGRSTDVLDRGEQLRIAARFGYQPETGLLPVERFMQDYFRHTSQVSHLTARFVARARSNVRFNRLVTAMFGHQVERDLHVGPAGILATPRGLKQVGGSLTAIIRTVDLANLYNKPIAAETWEAIRRQASQLPRDPSPEACRHFLSLLDHPARLAPLLRDLHDAGVLERFVPAIKDARGLLQFNEYHKYTVDEHCLRAVEFAARLLFDMGPLGRVYRQIRPKRVLHLALLIHDLGKGREADHLEAGLRIASETAARLGLGVRETLALEFLVHRHQLMNYLAFHRDTSDEQLVVRFAREVGSPELLQMLFALTAADLAAVGPGVWDSWKAEIVTELYHRTMQQLAGDSPATTVEQLIRRRREAAQAELLSEADPSWYAQQIDALPDSYLSTTQPDQVAADLRMLYDLEPGGAIAAGHYLPQTGIVQFTIGTHEEATPGVFHKLTGVLSSHGLQIRSADINTLADGLVLDRFCVIDPDYSGQPPPQRIEQVSSALVESLRASGVRPPRFPRRWRVGRHRRVAAPNPHDRISVDTTTSDRYTVFDVFTRDRTGLLYAVARTLFELELSVWRAKIGTYGEEVVDVFYVTDRQGRKVEDESRLGEIQRRLLEVIQSAEE